MKIFTRFVMWNEYGGSLELWDAIDEYSVDSNPDLVLKAPPVKDPELYYLGYRDITIEVDDNFIRKQFDLPIIEGRIDKSN